MTTFVKKYVMDYDMCQQMKNCLQQPFGPLMPNKVPNGPWEIISMNLITQLPESNDYNAIVTNFIRPYLHQFSIDSHGLNGYGKPLKRPFDRYQSRLEAINNGRDIRQINW